MNDIRSAKIGDWIRFDKKINDIKKSIYFQLQEIINDRNSNCLIWKGKAIIVPYNGIAEPEYHNNYELELEKYKKYDNALIVHPAEVFHVCKNHYAYLLSTCIYDKYINDMQNLIGQWITTQNYDDLSEYDIIGKIKDVKQTEYNIEFIYEELYEFYSKPNKITIYKEPSIRTVDKTNLHNFTYQIIPEYAIKDKLNKLIFN